MRKTEPARIFPDQARAFFIDLPGKCASGSVIAKMHAR
jgi:hypothetical protein